MTYRNSGSSPVSSAAVPSVQVTLGANIQPGDIITVGAVFAGNHSLSTGITATSSNGGSFVDVTGWQIAGSSRAGQAFRRVAIAGDASSTITLATNGGTTGRASGVYHAAFDLDTVTAPVVVVDADLAQSTDVIMPAATPTSGWSGGDVVRLAFGTATSGGTPTFSAASSGLTLRAQSTSNHGSSTNAAAVVYDSAFPDDTAVPAATTTASSLVGNQLQVTILYLETGVDQPIAEAGDNQQVSAGTTVQLDGSASGGSGSGYTYLWEKISGTQDVELDDETAADASFDTLASISDTIVLGLTVEDSEGVASIQDTVTIEVVGVENTAIPIEDVTTTGWTKDPTGAASFSALLADFDTDTFMVYVDPEGAVTAELKLSALPEAEPGAVVQFGYKPSMFGFSSTGATFTVKQGASTVIASRSDDFTDEDTIQTYIIQLTDTQIGTITDFEDLRLHWEFEGTA